MHEPVPFEHCVVIDAICIVRWGAQPTAEIVGRAAKGVLDARRAQRRPIVLIALMDPAMEEPSPRAIEAFMQIGPSFARACACAFAVVAHDAAHRQVQIGLLEAMKAFNPVPSEICDSLEDALRKASVAAHADVTEVLQTARMRGLLAPADAPRAPRA